jgi:hypothetical protein
LCFGALASSPPPTDRRPPLLLGDGRPCGRSPFTVGFSIETLSLQAIKNDVTLLKET